MRPDLLAAVTEWIRSIEARALEPAQLSQLMHVGAGILDTITPSCKRLWVRGILAAAAGILREEARDLESA